MSSFLLHFMIALRSFSLLYHILSPSSVCLDSCDIVISPLFSSVICAHTMCVFLNPCVTVYMWRFMRMAERLEPQPDHYVEQGVETWSWSCTVGSDQLWSNSSSSTTSLHPTVGQTQIFCHLSIRIFYHLTCLFWQSYCQSEWLLLGTLYVSEIRVFTSIAQLINYKKIKKAEESL